MSSKNKGQPFSQEELIHLSPFDKSLHKKVLLAVLAQMGESYDPNVEIPSVRISESVSETETGILNSVEDQGLPPWVLSKGMNMYLHRLNMIVLGQRMKIHNLAHELAHFVQFKYRHYHKDDMSQDHVEFEAIMVQNKFRPPKVKKQLEQAAFTQ